ncbi:MAG: dihydroneopterin aldolase [Acidobacteriota bacterium]|nr:dihydroneopterin aldolase [Acidobacteriota bacterium]
MKVELHGLRLHGYHGVHDSEARLGQVFLYDVELEVGDRGASDRIEDAVDYIEVAKAVREISDAHAYALIEALAIAVADELRARFRVRRATVRVTKPAVRPAGLEGTVSVIVSRPGR